MPPVDPLRPRVSLAHELQSFRQQQHQLPAQGDSGVGTAKKSAADGAMQRPATRAARTLFTRRAVWLEVLGSRASVPWETGWSSFCTQVTSLTQLGRFRRRSAWIETQHITTAGGAHAGQELHRFTQLHADCLTPLIAGFVHRYLIRLPVRLCSVGRGGRVSKCRLSRNVCPRLPW